MKKVGADVKHLLTAQVVVWTTTGDGRARLSSARRVCAHETTKRRAEDRRALPDKFHRRTFFCSPSQSLLCKSLRPHWRHD